MTAKKIELGRVIAFTTFQTLEHIEKLRDTINSLYDILEYDGVGLINVPNGEMIMKHNLYHQVLLEHINYFTPRSLITLAENAGFEILDVVLDKDTIEIDLYVKKNESISMEESYIEVQNDLNLVLDKYNKFGIYGAGQKSAYYSSLICKANKKKINHVFDSNKEKVGKYLSGINERTECVNNKTLQECDAVIIFASSYNIEIIGGLRKNGFKNDIIFFEDDKVKLDSLKK